jgi:hypothetical protein
MRTDSMKTFIAIYKHIQSDEVHYFVVAESQEKAMILVTKQFPGFKSEKWTLKEINVNSANGHFILNNIATRRGKFFPRNILNRTKEKV